jgi:hypothetical protein
MDSIAKFKISVLMNSGNGETDDIIGALDNAILVYLQQTGGVWRRPLSEMTSSVEPMPTDLPARFKLEQNYPNPFNPSTTFSFSVPAGTDGLTSLRVFDILGREVADIVNEKLVPGDHMRTWDASGIPGGMYFYQLRVGGVSQTRKLVLLK